MSDFWLSLTTNLGTIVLMIFISDRVYRLIYHWLDLQSEKARALTRQQILGPKPIQLVQEHREEDAPA